MSSFDGKAVALRYDGTEAAPVVVASGLGYMAQKIVEVASENNIPVYEDSSLATVLSQFKLGQEIPEELYAAIVEIYVYFLKFDPASKTAFTPAVSADLTNDSLSEQFSDQDSEEPEN